MAALSSAFFYIFYSLLCGIFGVTILPNGDWYDDWNTVEWDPNDIVLGAGTSFDKYHGWFWTPIGSPAWLHLERSFTQPFDSIINISYTFVWGCDVCKSFVYVTINVT